MSLQQSERLAATTSRPTQEPVRPTRTQISTRPSRQSTGSHGLLWSIHPRAYLSTSRSGAKRARADSDDSDGGDHGGSTDPAKVKWPITRLVGPSLATAWRVNQKHDMCFIFDSTSPAHRFKRGMVFNEEANFPEDTQDGEITKTDGPGPGWMPVDPAIV